MSDSSKLQSRMKGRDWQDRGAGLGATDFDNARGIRQNKN